MAVTLRNVKGTRLTHAEMDENFKSVMGGHNFLHIQDQKIQGANGGTFTSGAWQTRDLNTVLTNTITGASLAANQITLPVGKYYVEASAPAFKVDRHLIQIDTGSGFLVGRVEQCAASDNCATTSHVSGIINISSTATVSLEHRCMTSHAQGYGYGSNWTTEVFSDIRIWRIGEYVAP